MKNHIFVMLCIGAFLFLGCQSSNASSSVRESEGVATQYVQPPIASNCQSQSPDSVCRTYFESDNIRYSESWQPTVDAIKEVRFEMDPETPAIGEWVDFKVTLTSYDTIQGQDYDVLRQRFNYDIINETSQISVVISRVVPQFMRRDEYDRTVLTYDNPEISFRGENIDTGTTNYFVVDKLFDQRDSSIVFQAKFTYPGKYQIFPGMLVIGRITSYIPMDQFSFNFDVTE